MSSPQSFAHYTVVEKIGAGGMGEVFRATDSKLNRDVALKMLPDTLIDNVERLARFQREAQVLAQLNHHGIAAIYGLESEGSRHALAMELVEGPDLSDKLTSGALPTAEALDLALQLAEAIESAHEKGIVHRDLKPANIKINTEGRVKVLDFGLAKALTDDPTDSAIDPAMSPTLTANMTMGNVILGTAAYMSPEQARGTEVDKRADIWAYGVVLVEMMGGRKLFAGETVSDTLASVLQASIDLDDLPKDLPASVKRMIKRCLERDPRQRLRDIGDARLILQDAINGPEEEAEEAPKSKGNAWLQYAGFALAAIAVIVAMSGILTPAPETEFPLRKFDIAMERSDPASSIYFAPAISPGGRYLAYVSGDRLWLRDLASMISRELVGTEGGKFPFWSPDGAWLGFVTDTEIRKIDRSGGQIITLARLGGNTRMSGASSAVWNEDGTIFYTTSNSGIFKTSAHAGEVTMHLAPGEGDVDFHELCRLPGGAGWAFVVHTAEDYGRIDVLTPDGDRKTILHFPGESFNTPTWSPTGHLLFKRQDVAPGLWAVPFDPDRLETTGESFLVAADSEVPTVAVDGTLVYTTGVQQDRLQLAWFDREGRLLETIGMVNTTRPFPSLSPDGRTVAIPATADDGREIFLYDADGGSERRLTFDRLNYGTVSWHPDGKRLITYSEPEYLAHLITVDGSEPRRDQGLGILSDYSADGVTLFMSVPNLELGFDFDIAARPAEADSSQNRILVQSEAIEWWPRPSPDGGLLAYVSNESGIQEVYLTTYPGTTGRWVVSRGGGQWPVWSADGTTIYYTTRREIFAVDVGRTAGISLSRPRKVMDRPSIDWNATWFDAFDMTADGERFVMVAPLEEEGEEKPRMVIVQNWFAEFSD